MTQLYDSHKPDIISCDGLNVYKQMQTTPSLLRKYQISCNFKNFRKTINFLIKVFRSVDSSYQAASGSIRLDWLASKMAKRGTNSFSNTLNAFISKCIFSTYLVLWRTYSIIIVGSVVAKWIIVWWMRRFTIQHACKSRSAVSCESSCQTLNSHHAIGVRPILCVTDGTQSRG